MQNIFNIKTEKITLGIILLAIGLLVGVLLSSPQRTHAPTNDQLHTEVSGEESIDPDTIDAIDQSSGTKEPICVGEFCDGSGDADDTSHLTVLEIPLISTVPGGDIGCGVSVFFAPHAIPKTKGVLNATYEKLFSLAAESEVPSDMMMNYIAFEHQLSFDKVSLSKGIARVYLSGQILASHCGIPAFRAQMEQAALQFDTVDTVEFYLNNQLYNWCQKDESDGEGPCPENPQYWVVD